MMLGDNGFGQHFSPTNIPVSQKSKRYITSVLVINGMGSDMHTRMEDNYIQI